MVYFLFKNKIIDNHFCNSFFVVLVFRFASIPDNLERYDVGVIVVKLRVNLL